MGVGENKTKKKKKKKNVRNVPRFLKKTIKKKIKGKCTNVLLEPNYKKRSLRATQKGLQYWFTSEIMNSL